MKKSINTKDFIEYGILKEWLIETYKLKGGVSLNSSIRNSKIIQKYLILHTPHLVENVTYSERAFNIMNNLTNIQICPICKTNKLKYHGGTIHYAKNCSAQCNNKNPEKMEKTKKTNLERYGVENVYQNEDIKNKIKATNLKNFGHEYNTQTQEFKDHCKKLNMERYGVESYSQTQEFHYKIRATSLEKYGVEHMTQSEEFKNKLKETNLKKYGVDHQFKDPIVREKISSTIKERYGKNWYTETAEFQIKHKENSLIKYGVEHPTQAQTVKDKMKQTCMEKYGSENYSGSDIAKKFMLEKWGIEYPFHGKYKDYTLPSGRIIKIQGYENYALDILLKNYKEEDLLIVDKEIRNRLGKIMYLDPSNNKERQYLLDIYIISENKVIEVKSEFTLYRNLEINLIKKEACINKGLLYEFWIFDNRGILKIL